MMLRLEVVDYEGPSRWRWRLSDETGAFVADHQVDVDAGAWQFGAFTDLEGYLRWYAAPDRRLQSEAELAAQVGEWIGTELLGAVGAALAQRPGVVRVEVPVAAGVLSYRPWELAFVNGKPLAAQHVSLVIDQFADRPLRVKSPVGERLRMLAVFSLPEDASALNLRLERYALAQLVHEIAATNGKAVELRVLQYGATRERLEDTLLEADGWDVLHLSGHGLPAGLLLENDAGQRDLITSGDLVDLLDASAAQIKLITLSTCESAAVTATEHLQLLGLTPPPSAGSNGAAVPDTDQDAGTDGQRGADRSWNTTDPGGAGGLSAVATVLVDRLDCAVLAMRYPVIDDFAIALAGSFYNLVLGKGQAVARALALSMPRVTVDPPSPGAPALSVATPALFGARAADLRLVPPVGAPLVFQAEAQKLAGFPPQPERFVGRVGPMTRATTALAPRSTRAGVLFHGMAGAGKTACALELAYTHEAAFQRLVWHQGPPESHGISTALTNFALDMERQIPGLHLVHLVDNVQELTAFLPVLTEFLQHARVLIVLDNLETLLTDAGEWRDPRWALVVDALCGHGGLSRVVLTSRRRPAGLPVVVEAVHALSLAETVLLAREWPHLKALMDTPGTGGVDDPMVGRGLAARVLRVVQGHPKLIELADGQATRPAVLAARLDDVDRTWMARGVRLQEFLNTGESQASGEDFFRVLDTWTRTAATHLPDASAVLFTVLAGLEDPDRVPFVLNQVWPVLWRDLGHSEPVPNVAETVRPLVNQALIAADRNPGGREVVRFRMHPGIAETTRIHTDSDAAILIDTLAAEFWRAVLQAGLEEETENSRWVLRGARAAAPYLARCRDWDTLDSVLNEVLIRDKSPVTVAALLPFLSLTVQGTAGTDLEIDCRLTYAKALVHLRPAEAAVELRGLRELAHARNHRQLASIILGDLINLCMSLGQLEEALNLAIQGEQEVVAAGFGPWTQLAAEVRRLQILRLQGNHRDVLDSVEQFRARMAALPAKSGQPESVDPWNVRENVLQMGSFAARDMEMWQLALDMNAEKVVSQRARGATDREVAASQFSDYGPLRGLNRLGEARALVLSCREVFEAHQDIDMLGRTMSALANIEDALGRGASAISLERDALRLNYTAGDVESIGTSHHSLANYLAPHAQKAREVWAHRLAAAVLGYQTSSGRLSGRLLALAQLHPNYEVPLSSFSQICAIVDQVDGVHLGELVAGLPRQAVDGQAAVTEVLSLASSLARQLSEQETDLDPFLQRWNPVISALVVATQGDVPGLPHGGTTDDRVHEASAFLTQEFDRLSDSEDWAALVVVLRRVLAGDRDRSALAVGLDPVDQHILGRALSAVNGSDPIAPPPQDRQPGGR